MKVIRETCIAGNVIDITIKVSAGNHKGKRADRQHVTEEKVKKNNDRIAAKKLARILNANFGKDAAHVTLTYKEEPENLEEAKKILNRFMNRMRSSMKKMGKDFKWVIATEFKGKRVHHHLITDAPRELIEKKWREGFCFYQPFDNNPNRNKLAEYIIKESKHTFRDDSSPFGTRYSHSRNLIIPEVRVEEVSPRMLTEDPVAWKGYYIDRDSVRRYEHPVTGLEYVEYMMVADTEKPRIKKYYKGRRKTREEDYRKYIAEEKQMDMLI